MIIFNNQKKNSAVFLGCLKTACYINMIMDLYTDRSIHKDNF